MRRSPKAERAASRVARVAEGERAGLAATSVGQLTDFFAAMSEDWAEVFARPVAPVRAGLTHPSLSIGGGS